MIKKTRYYFFISSFHKESPDYMKPLSVHRMRDGERGTYPERWDSKSNEWVSSSGVIAASGIGGDNPYERTTEAEAMKFIASHAGATRTASR
jgi:hypothetical protein